MLLNQAHSKNWRRLILCILMFAWVNASAQPCAMDVSDQDSPPVAAGHDHSGHAGHGAHGSAPDDVQRCGHCPPGGATIVEHCAGGMNVSCGALPDASSEVRKAESKLKLPDFPPEVTSPYDFGDGSGPHAVTVPFDPGLLKRRTNPPLSLRHCVFLK